MYAVNCYNLFSKLSCLCTIVIRLNAHFFLCFPMPWHSTQWLILYCKSPEGLVCFVWFVIFRGFSYHSAFPCLSETYGHLSWLPSIHSPHLFVFDIFWNLQYTRSPQKALPIPVRRCGAVLSVGRACNAHAHCIFEWQASSVLVYIVLVSEWEQNRVSNFNFSCLRMVPPCLGKSECKFSSYMASGSWKMKQNIMTNAKTVVLVYLCYAVLICCLWWSCWSMWFNMTCVIFEAHGKALNL